MNGLSSLCPALSVNTEAPATTDAGREGDPDRIAVPGLDGHYEANTRVANILLLYSTVYGHTVKIGEFIKAEAAAKGDTVVLRALAEGAADGDSFDAIVIGASIR